MSDVAPLVDGLRARDRASIARALNLVEDRRAETRDDRRALARALAAFPRAPTIGVTGPPGAGKSTLCAALVRARIDRGERVGVVAVDPSSARSGGALLGDRLRIVTGDDPRLFVRSLAAGGDLGGLSRLAPACVDVLAAASDVAIVETVGVGQSEIDVAKIADVTIVVVQPASGDALQFLKAGVLEIPDLLVVNKSDLGDAASRAESELRHALGVARGAGVEAEAKVVRVSALTGDGVDALSRAVDERLEALARNGVIASRRRDGAIARVFSTIERAIGEIGRDTLGADLDGRIERAIDDGAPASEVAEALVDEAIARIRHGAP